MKRPLKTIFASVLLAGAATGTPVSAQVGISFGFDDAFTDFAPCDYYRYYEKPPPWGLPDDYCDDLVSFDPIFFDGFWYRGPIYHRHHHGKDEVWLHGGWHENNWQGRRPDAIVWQERGQGFRADFHPARDGARRVEAAQGGEGAGAHVGSSPAVHGGEAPAIHTGGEAPSVHVATPSSGESRGGGGSSESHGSGGNSSGGGIHR